jgi:hypothetical protein
LEPTSLANIILLIWENIFAFYCIASQEHWKWKESIALLTAKGEQNFQKSNHKISELLKVQKFHTLFSCGLPLENFNNINA